MIWQFNGYTIALLAVAGIAEGVSVAAWKRRSNSGALPLSILMTGLVIWAVAQALEVAVVDVAGKIFWSRIQYGGIVIVPTFWLIVSLQYTGLAAEWLTPPVKRFLVIFPALTVLMVWTNEYHHWIWVDVTTQRFGRLHMWKSSYGPGFWVHTAYSYTLLLIGLLLLIYRMVKSPPLYRNQTIILLSGAIVPWVVNALSIFRVIKTPINLTAFGFTLAGTVAYWGLFHYRLLEVSPVARDALVDSMRDAVIVLDQAGRIVDVNMRVTHLVERPASEMLGAPLTAIFPQWNSLFGPSEHTFEAHHEAQMTLGGRKSWYDVRISPLYEYGYRQKLLGRIVVLHDISDRVQLEISLEEQVRRVRQLLEVARATTESPTLDDTMHTVVSMAMSITDAQTGILVLIDKQEEVSHTTSMCEEAASDQLVNPLNSEAKTRFIQQILQAQETILVNDVKKSSEWLSPPETPCPIAAALGIPILYREKLLGVLLLLHTTPQHFKPTDVETLEIAVRQMALALGNALIYEGQRTVAEQQTVLFEVLRALQHPMLMQPAMTEAVSVIVRLTHWPVVAILTQKEQEQFTVDVVSGQQTEKLLPVCTESSHLVEDRNQDTVRHFPQVELSLSCVQTETLPSVMLIPLESRVKRMLLIASDMPDAFNADARLLANSIGNVMSLVLRNAHLYETISTEQQRLAALVHASDDGIILIGMDNNILVMSQMALRYLELEGTPSDWIYRPLPDALRVLRPYAPDVVKATLAELKRFRHGDITPGEGEYQIRGRTIHWSNLPVLDGERSVGRLLILRDVTEERQFTQMREDLTHTMVHDLRNPLTGIHSAIWLLKRQLRDTVNDNDQMLLDIAQRSTSQLLDLVNAILDISRLESGHMPLDITQFDLVNLVSEILDLQIPLAHEKHIQLISEIPAKPLIVQADRNLIRRVLQNLIGNALKFTVEGGTVRLSSVCPPAPAGAVETTLRKVHFSISDTGPGIPPEIREQLFQKFVTGLQTGHGSGLGLTFCKMVLEAHDERIWVESTPGQGATFTFTLPLATEQMF